MKTWKQLLVRHGWNVNEIGKDEFDCSNETKENIIFLQECLENAGVDFQISGDQLIFNQGAIDEGIWIKAVNYEGRGITGAYWCRPGIDVPEIRYFDTYIVGVVRQLNRLQFFTTMCCDGHGKRTPFIDFEKSIHVEWLVELLQVLGIKRVTYRENRLSYHVPLHLEHSELLCLAESLSSIHPDWLDKGASFIEEQLFYQKIESILMVPGVSGEEDKIREVVKEKLAPFVDHIVEDSYGNLLAEKTYGGGTGPTILLNAHLDTVEEIVPGRVIVKDEHIWSSSEGILGADDRAGVAVVLSIAKHLNQSDFRGKVKFIFTVEEEIGLVGAKHVEPYFLWDVDCAIVIDRRGKGDIVTSCWGSIPFCSLKYGQFFETVAEEEGLTEWACTAGGSSDTRVWASRGIQSVNLSVGYGNEHTEDEYLDVKAAYETYIFVKAIFKRSGELYRVLREISRVKAT